MRLGSSTLAEGLVAYPGKGDVLVPLGELCSLLDLAITVDVGRGEASGFFLSESRLFRLDVATGRAVVEGKEKPFDPGSVELHADDLFVPAALVSAWFPLRLDVDLYGSVINVRPGEPLPIQSRLERERRLRSALRGAGPAGPRFPVQATPYRLLDGPFLDQSLRYGREPGVSGEGAGRLDYSTSLTGEILFMSANAFVSGTDRGVTDARLTLGRKDPEGRMLGFLGAREVAVGDVFHPGLDLIASPQSGPGLVLSNAPLQAPTQFDRESFRGSLPSGWTVELYRNDELLGYAASRGDGLYEFLDVSLRFGMNIFRLEFHGPQGQRRRESRFLNIGQSLTPPGAVTYRLAAADPSERFLGTGRPDAGPRATFELAAGLVKNLSASVSVAAVDLPDGRHEYAKVGLRGFWGWLFANADAAVDRKGGSAFQGTLQSRVGGFGFFVQHAELQSFETDFFQDAAAPLRRRTTVRVDAAIPKSFLPRLPVSLEAEEDVLESGLRTDRVVGRLSAAWRGVFLSNQTSWIRSRAAGASSSSATGQVLVSRPFGALSLRGDLSYALSPVARVNSAGLFADLRRKGGYVVSAGLSRAFHGGETRLLAGVSKLEGPFGFGVSAVYSFPGGLGGGISVTAGIGRDPRAGRWHTQAGGLAGLGALSGRAFLDTNGNGAMDGGERPIPEAAFLVNGGGREVVSDEKGLAFLPSLPPNQRIDVSVSPTSLEDPSWKPSPEGIGVVPRPGKTAIVDFPVVAFGEVTGTVYVNRESGPAPAGGVELEVVDAKGEVSKRVRSAYDGFYELVDIRPGNYTLRVAEASLGRIRVERTPPPKAIVLLPTGSLLEGIDFVLEPAGAASAASAEPPAPERSPATEQPPAPEPVTGAVPTAWTGAEPVYGVQTGSYKDPEAARREALRLASRLGLPVHVIPVVLGPGALWHRVLVGATRTPAEAFTLQEDLRRERRTPVGLVFRIEPARDGSTPNALRPVPEPVRRSAPAADEKAAPLVTRDWSGREPVFVVHAASYRDRSKADAEAARLARSFDTVGRSVEVELAAKGRWYRVVLGDFPTAPEARRFGASVAGKLPDGAGGVYRMEGTP